MTEAESIPSTRRNDEPLAASSFTLSLTDGGPAYELFRRLRLVQSGRRGDAIRIAIVLALGTWLPLVILCLSEGLAFGGSQIPLLYDFEPHVRFLFALPVLILAEITVGQRIRDTVRHFVDSGLVAREDEERFVTIIEDTIRFRDSRVATVILVLLTVGFEWHSIATQIHLGVGTWVRPVVGGPLSSAGYWYAIVAVPIYQFIILRWGYRIVVWGRFLAALARMDLRLMPTHPDEAGGIGFLGRTIVPFGTIGLALSAVLSASIAPRVMFAGENIYAELPVYGVLIAASLIISIGPLLFFTPRLHALKHQGLAKYGTLATTYTQQFHAKWVTHTTPTDEPLLGTGDIQSLADLGNSYQVIQKMKLVPVAKEHLFGAVAPPLIPAVFLATTVVPLDKILQTLMKVFV
jgi:hypothetical protein